MRSVRALWREERRAHWFFAAHLQGGLGAGAGYIALMLLAYERIGSAWAATAVLLADLLPAMLLGPLLGGLIDRTSRLGCAIVADVLRAAAFAGLVFADGIAPMLALALAAGLGNALFRPATTALLPSLVAPEHLTAANALYGIMRDVGQILGPVCAAAMLLLAGPQLVIGLNGLTFAISALLLLPLRGHLRSVRRRGRRAGAPFDAGRRPRRAARARGPHADDRVRRGRARRRRDERRRARARPAGAGSRPRRLRPARQRLWLRADLGLAPRRPRRRRGRHPPPLPRRHGADGGRARSARRSPR